MIYNGTLAKQIAQHLLKIEAVKLSPKELFTWTSGIQSPIYCDNRKTLSFPEVRSAIIEGFCNAIREKFPEATCIAGVATAGIPHGALIAEKLGLPFAYIRSSAKGHGLKNRIEGIIADDAKVVVIEDLISTGKSSLEAVDAIHEESKATILGLAAIFTYGFASSHQRFVDKKVPFVTLSEYSVLIEEAKNSGYVGEDDMAVLQEFRSQR